MSGGIKERTRCGFLSAFNDSVHTTYAVGSRLNQLSDSDVHAVNRGYEQHSEEEASNGTYSKSRKIVINDAENTGTHRNVTIELEGTSPRALRCPSYQLVRRRGVKLHS